MFLTCVGRGGARIQRHDVMFQFNKDLFLFSLGEERNEEVDSAMGALLRRGRGSDLTSWELQFFVVGVSKMDMQGFSRTHTHTGTHELVLWLLQFVCLGGPIFSSVLTLFLPAC